MSLSVGIVGLPNVGKSTLFNALMKREIAKVGKHPFTTISPNKGIIAVPDERLNGLIKMIKTKTEVKPASIEFVDIAGLVKGAAEGAGLGNQFLSYIREVDLILHVLREFKNSQAPHVMGRIDPIGDINTVELELILADFEAVSKALTERRKKRGSDRKAQEEILVLEKIKSVLEQGKPAATAGLEEEEKEIIKSFNFLTLKPTIFILNIDEKHLEEKGFTNNKFPSGIVIPVCIRLAADLYQLKTKEREEYLKELKIKKTGLEQVIKTAYKTLQLISFYTIKGGKKISSWSLKEGSTAIEAAGKIHTDFAKKFIKAETIDYKRLIKAGSWQKAKEKGWLNLKGKDYQIKDGEVIEFKFAK